MWSGGERMKTISQIFYTFLYKIYEWINYKERKCRCKYRNRKLNICKNPENIGELNCFYFNEQKCPQNSQRKEYDFTHGLFQIEKMGWGEMDIE